MNDDSDKKLAEKLISTELPTEDVIQEMAHVNRRDTRFQDVRVELHSDDHPPPHCHLKDDRGRTLKVSLEGADVIGSQPKGLSWDDFPGLRRKYLAWAEQPSYIAPKITNAELRNSLWELWH